MAIDKNSKAYQWLLAKWYTDEQITQMSWAVAWWQNAKDVVANTPTTTTAQSDSYVYNPTSWYYEKPNTPTQPTQQPQQPTQTTPEVKQETETKQAETVGDTVPEIQQQGALKPLSQDYYNQTSDEAQSKIINNLNNYRQTNPEYFRDYESFKKNFSYDARNDEQKQTLDSWYGGYQKWMELAWIPVTDLYTQYKDGQVSMNELENLRIYDPTKYAELQNQINKWNIIAAYDDDKGEDGTWLSLQDMAYNAAVQMFTKFMSGDSSSGASQYFRDYEEKMESPEMLALSDQCTEVQEQMENIQSDLDSIKKSVEAEYEWTWATRSKINAIIADRSYDLQLQLRTLNSEYNKYATQYNNRMQQYQNEFNMQLQEYQINQDARNQQMKELWFAMDLMNFETNDQKQQREWDYWVKQQEYTNWNINSKDYDTRYKAALKSVQNLLSQYEGIPMQRSAEQMAQDILKAIDNGSDLGAELTKINKQIQEKPEYKYLYNQTYKPATASGFNLESYKVWDTEYVVYNGEMMTAADFNSKYWGKAVWATWEAKPYDIVDSKVFSQAPVDYGYNTLWTFLLNKKEWQTWWWCGAFVNQYLKEIWVTNGNYYDNDLSTKLNSVNTQIPKVWSIAVYDYWHITKETWQNHGHVWIVTKVYEDGSYDVIDSNFDSDKKIKVRTHLNPQSSNCKWFFDPSQPPAWSNTAEDVSTGWFVTSRIWAYDKYINQWTKPTDALLKWWGNWDIAKWMELFESEVEAYKQSQWYNNNYSPEADAEILDLRKEFNKLDSVKTYESMRGYYDKMMRANNGTAAWDMAMVFNFMKMLDPGSVVREWEYANAASTAWLGTRLVWYFKKIDSWQILTKSQRDDFISIAKDYLQWAADIYNNDLRKYQSYVTKWWDVNKIWTIIDLNSNGQSTNQSTNQSTLQSVNNSSLQSNRWSDLLPSTSVNTSTWAWSTVNVGWYYFPSTF